MSHLDMSREPIEVPGSKARFAFAFYATNNNYATSIMVAVRAFEKLGRRRDVDTVVLYHGVDAFVLRALRALGIHTVRVSPVPHAEEGYFQDSLTKLRVLQLQQYDRVVFIDADILPLRPIDDLFDEDWSGTMAAPPAYWLPDDMVTTALFAFHPSASLWARASLHFSRSRQERLFDMDVINLEFGDELHRLPDEFLCLNSEYGDRDRQGHFGNPYESYDRVRLIHFTELGKPWFYSPRSVRCLRQNACEQFHQSWEQWWKLRDELIGEQTPIDRLLHRVVGYRARRRRPEAESSL